MAGPLQVTIAAARPGGQGNKSPIGGHRSVTGERRSTWRSALQPRAGGLTPAVFGLQYSRMWGRQAAAPCRRSNSYHAPPQVRPQVNAADTRPCWRSPVPGPWEPPRCPCGSGGWRVRGQEVPDGRRDLGGLFRVRAVACAVDDLEARIGEAGRQLLLTAWREHEIVIPG